MTRNYIERLIVRALDKNLCYWVLDIAHPFCVVSFMAIGRFRGTKREVVEIEFIAGPMQNALVALDVFRRLHPKVKTFVYQRKSRYNRRRLKVTTLYEKLQRTSNARIHRSDDRRLHKGAAGANGSHE